MRRLLIVLAAIGIAFAAWSNPAFAQGGFGNVTGYAITTCGSPPVAYKPSTSTQNRPGPFTIDANGLLCVNATVSVSASIAGFAPGGSYANLTSNATSHDAALPTGAVDIAFNTGTTAVSCELSVGAGTAVASENVIQPGSWLAFTVGSNTHTACINQAGDSASNVVVFSGGTGLPTGAGGGSGSGGGGGNVNLTQILSAAPSATNPLWVSPATGATFPVSGTFWQTTQPVSLTSTTITGTVAVTQASASIASGAFASGSISSGAVASGAFASGAIASGAIASGAIVSGGDVTEGTTAETTVYAGSGGCTVVACLKGLYAGIVGSIPAGTNTIGAAIVQGQAAAARNFPGCTVGATTTNCLAASTATQFLQIQNTSTSATIACAFGAAGVLNSKTSVQLAVGQSASWNPNTGGVPTGQLNCIASAGSTPLYVEWL
jgi:hypothetical protein